MFWLRWHTFVGMDSAVAVAAVGSDDNEVNEDGDEEAVDSVAGASADADGAADVHVGQNLA